MKPIDLTGDKYGRLTALSRAENKAKKSAWNCVCECGNRKVVTSTHLRAGRVRSCGCLAAESRGQARKTHGMTGTKPYKIWRSMIDRCYYPSQHAYPYYGGRGITICDRWLDFQNFYRDMGDIPEGMTIDRVDNEGNYEPDNCHWATKTDQANNKRNNRMLTWKGKKQTMAQWAREVDINYFALRYRIDSGWSIERAFTMLIGGDCGKS